VVGVAGHAGTVRTLSWAINESAASGAQLVVVHGRLGLRGGLGALQTVDRPAAGAVVAARLRLGETSVRVIVSGDEPGELLVREAGPEDILVLGGPLRPGWSARSGTVRHVMSRARCPVIVVNERWELPVNAPARARSADARSYNGAGQLAELA